MHLRNFILYVAGPYTGITEEDVSTNIAKAGAIAQLLWDEGFSVICPHTNTAHFTHDKTSYDDYVEGCLTILARCDGVVSIEGWKKSKGAIAEKERAVLLTLPVFDLSIDSIETIKKYYERKRGIDNA